MSKSAHWPTVIHPTDTAVMSDDLDRALTKDLLAEEIVACDIETSGLDWARDRIGTFQLHSPAHGAVVVLINGETPRRIGDLLQDPGVCKVFHHATFDVRFILSQWGVRTQNVKCTKIASKVVFSDASSDAHSLKALLDRVGNVEISKNERLSDWLSEHLTSDQVRYASDDVAYLIPLIETLEAEAAALGLLELLHGCFRHIPVRAELDVRGFGDVYAY